MKKYLANTTVSVSVSLPNGGNARVSFSPLSDGTSVYYTDDKEIQFALEHHYKFGKLFCLVEDSQETTAAKKPTKAPAKKNSGKSTKKSNTEQPASANELPTSEEEAEDSPAAEDPEDEESQEGEGEPKEVTVSDLDAAKDYLAENFDIVRTKLKTEEIINKTALSLGIVFKYL
ncbi:hypothetical protein [uncultured Duncaniella sp.]|uniref:hypothetical protein n=1 Tax=uncultured Duncaniella sp. TaxID=2768039 RepID=UPI0026F3C406|nr:hypothetical protein [uncultured Duncaniella sp.]